MNSVWIGVIISLAVGAQATAQQPPAETHPSDRGEVLANVSGMTLYVFDKDPGGKSVCNGPCAANWPPLIANPSATAGGDYSLISRDDGSTQWAYRGRPLYTWVKDQKPGDTTGDGLLNNTWHVAKP